LRFDRSVAFTGRLGEGVEIHDFDISPAVTNKIGLLQRMGDHRYAVATGADHLRDRFLGQDKGVAARQIAGAQISKAGLETREDAGDIRP
jgi:hypothetical protein